MVTPPPQKKKMGENNRFSFAKTSFGKLHSELSGFVVGEIASLDDSLSVFTGVGWLTILSLEGSLV